jgi:hypothetical protein
MPRYWIALATHLTCGLRYRAKEVRSSALSLFHAPGRAGSVFLTR